MLDSGVEAGVSGVSSFGFGGTNARADIWGRAKTGFRKTGEATRRRQKDATRRIQVQCPVTLGPIDYLTGEPISEVMLSGSHKRADVLRDVLAAYDVSRYAYGGGFRYRLCEPMDAFEEDLPERTEVKIFGSWSWQSREGRVWETMKAKGDGVYSIDVVLGETRHETFVLSLNGDREQLIYPIVKNAGQFIHILGPDYRVYGRHWLVDGRDEEVLAGTVYRINFKWGVLNKRIWWEKLDTMLPNEIQPQDHRYCVVGSFTSWNPQEMALSATEAGAWHGTYRIGPMGREHFRFQRDFDPDQAIYPARANTQSMGVPLQGPDDLCAGRSWLVSGEVGDIVRLRLKMADCEITVEVSGDCTSTKVWENLPGWDRHHYYALGSWNDFEPTPMIMDEDNPGTFRFRVVFDGSHGSFNHEMQVYQHTFQVAVDGLPRLAYYPDCDEGETAFMGKYIALGPIPEDDEAAAGCDRRGTLAWKKWAIRSREVGTVCQISFTPKAPDRRTVVTWSYV